jgi:hypothetical protein
LGKPQERRLKAGGPGTDSVEGLPREEEIAKQQGDGLDRRESSARVGRGQVSFEDRGEVQWFEEVVDYGEGIQGEGSEGRCGIACLLHFIKYYTE